jgi:hypothetical protein
MGMMQRWNRHVYAALHSDKGRWHFPNAIRKYGKDAFSHEVLEVCDSIEVSNLAEQCWIEFYETLNPSKGFNLAKGGEFKPHGIRKNPWDDPEYRAKNSMTRKLMWKNPIFRAKQIAAIRAAAPFRRNPWDDPEYRAKLTDHVTGLGARSKGKPLSPEHRAKIGVAHKGRKLSPEHIAKTRNFKHTPEVHKKIADANRGRTATEETRAKLRAVMTSYWASMTPEERSKTMSDMVKKRKRK